MIKGPPLFWRVVFSDANPYRMKHLITKPRQPMHTHTHSLWQKSDLTQSPLWMFGLYQEDAEKGCTLGSFLARCIADCLINGVCHKMDFGGTWDAIPHSINMQWSAVSRADIKDTVFQLTCVLWLYVPGTSFIHYKAIVVSSSVLCFSL